MGRLKIEKRPLMLVKARIGDKEITTILQNAGNHQHSPESAPYVRGEPAARGSGAGCGGKKAAGISV
ncbi:MAG: 3-dehydroquinate synthase II [Desulfobacterales bacterium]